MLWTVGRPEDGPAQFGGAWPQDGAALRYEVGRTTPAGHWPLFHPSPLDAGTGWREHRAEVVFTVVPGQVPESGCVLELRFAGSHGPCPDIAVELDGRHRGLHHPVVIRQTRAEVDRQGPIAGECALDIPLPAHWLAPGRHVLALTTTVDRDAATGLPGVDVPHGTARTARGVRQLVRRRDHLARPRPAAGGGRRRPGALRAASGPPRRHPPVRGAGR